MAKEVGSPGRLAGPILLLLGSLASLGDPASAQTRKLSAPLPRLPGQVREHWLTPDGERCLFLANPEVQALSLFLVSYARPKEALALGESLGEVAPDGVRLSRDGQRVLFTARGDLYGASLTGRIEVVRLAGPSLTGAYIQDNAHEIAPDGSRAVFWAERQLAAPDELYSVALDGHAGPVLLAPHRSGFGNRESFSITPDGTTVVYTADQDSSNVFELYSVPIDGSASSLKLSGTLASNRDVGSFRVSADGTRVVYASDQERDDVFELFVTRCDGSTVPQKLSGTMGSRGDVLAPVVIGPGDARVFYLADATIDDVVELFSAPLDASAPPARLNAALAPHGDVHAFHITPDGSRVVYVADQDVDTILGLYVAPADGIAAPVPLAGPPVADSNEGFFQISSDGQSVVYRATNSRSGSDLYSVRLEAGASAVWLAPTIAWFEISPDGTTVVARTQSPYPEFTELLGVPIGGGSRPVVLGRMGHLLPLEGAFSIAPDSRSVVFHSDQEKPGVVGLYRMPIDASAAPVRLNPPLLPGPVVGDAGIVGIGAGGARAAYGVGVGGLQESLPAELWAVSLAGPAAPRRLFADRFHEDLYADLDPGGRWAVFSAIHLDGTYVELWSAPLDGDLPAARLSEPAGEPVYDPGENVVDYGLARRMAVFATRGEVLATALDGSQRPLSLTGPLLPARSVFDVELAPDGARAVYLAFDLARFISELFSVPTDGSSAPVRLNGALVARGSVRWVGLGSHGGRAVYLADQEMDEVNELYSVPLDGSGPATKLSGTLVSRGDVSLPILVSPDGARVVYAADAVVDGFIGIYSVPIDGSTPPVELYRPLVPAVSSFVDLRISPDGRRVIFLADPEGDGSLELYAVRVDGGTLRRLNAPLVAGGSVLSGYQLGPLGRTVVYRADQATDERIELFSVPVHGQRAPTRLSAGGPYSDVEAGFIVSPDGSLVVFTADARLDEVIELFEVPIRGGLPQRVHPPLAAFADVLASAPELLAITPDSRAVLYSADADTDEVFELFASPLHPPADGRTRAR